MSGTHKGGLKAVATTKNKFGGNFYAKIGAIGGRKSANGGFASTKVGKDGLTGAQRAIVAGRKGGNTPKKNQKIEAVHGDGMKYELSD